VSNPYLIEGPALISFSGGRTSAYMLYQILQAHGGKLPDNVVVAFANTGKEREETLRFVHECGSRWDVKIHWVEWRRGKPGYEEVGFNSASRDGEPFADLIAWKQRLPNSFERWCTEFLKVKPMFALMRETMGLSPGEFQETIGLRDDEGVRIFKGLEAAERHGRRVVYPLASAKVKKPDIWKFWLGENRDPKHLTNPLPQGFDLGLYPWEGNCTLCFQKGKGIRKRYIRENPSEPAWWIAQEVSQNGWFDKRDLVSELVAQVRANPSFFDADDDMEYDVECGLHCALEAAE
jgi:3'-phosphoadenosine 5'-phosphosulfate sulfotransferase (PAPS reductase)/FAD synthetase